MAWYQVEALPRLPRNSLNADFRLLICYSSQTIQIQQQIQTVFDHREREREIEEEEGTVWFAENSLTKNFPSERRSLDTCSCCSSFHCWLPCHSLRSLSVFGDLLQSLHFSRLVRKQRVHIISRASRCRFSWLVIGPSACFMS